MLTPVSVYLREARVGGSGDQIRSGKPGEFMSPKLPRVRKGNEYNVQS